MLDPVVRVAAREAELEEDALDPAQVLEGDPRTSAFVLAESTGGAESGIWQCTPGRFRDTETEEGFVVLSGKATIEWAGGAIEVGAGDLCHLAAGTETVWTVHGDAPQGVFPGRVHELTLCVMMELLNNLSIGEGSTQWN